jgi:hypothetical protein
MGSSYGLLILASDTLVGRLSWRLSGEAEINA